MSKFAVTARLQFRKKTGQIKRDKRKRERERSGRARARTRISRIRTYWLIRRAGRRARGFSAAYRSFRLRCHTMPHYLSGVREESARPINDGDRAMENSIRDRAGLPIPRRSGNRRSRSEASSKRRDDRCPIAFVESLPRFGDDSIAR